MSFEEIEERLMDELMECPGTPRELAEDTGIPPNKILEVLTDLAKRGLTEVTGFSQGTGRASPIFAMAKTRKTA